MKVLVYLEEKRLSPRGGPYGVGYYYFSEMKNRDDDILEFLPSNDIGGERREKMKKIVNCFPKIFNKIQRSIRKIISINKLFNSQGDVAPVDFEKYDAIHFHTTLDFYKQRNNLKEYNGMIILSSHSPVPFAQEIVGELNWFEKKCIGNVEKKYENVDKYAFEHADYLIFPCSEAEEPYFNNWKYYNNIHDLKKDKYRYVATGINEVVAKNQRSENRKQTKIPDSDFVVSYVGRHNEVKGYDLLKEIGSRILGEDENVWFVICGTESPLKRLEHNRWVEIGWTTDQYSYINSADVFILPNRDTYFDLVMLEVLSLGKIVVASRTGGNKFFERMNAKGVFLYDTIEEAVNILHTIRGMPIDERKLLERDNYNFYKTHLTASKMYENYISTLDEIVSNSDRTDDK